MITITLNGKAMSWHSDGTLCQLLTSFNFTTGGNVVAVNNVITPKSQWEQTKVNNDDRISVFSVVAGG
jgi:sulfur carrier protein